MYLETQEEQRCGKHAINNLLQGGYATTESLQETAKRLSKTFDIPERELAGRYGMYDASVIVSWLQEHHYEVNELFPRSHFSVQAPVAKTIGYICGNGSHWWTVLHSNTRGCFVHIDSMEDKTYTYGTIQEMCARTNPIVMLEVSHTDATLVIK